MGVIIYVLRVFYDLEYFLGIRGCSWGWMDEGWLAGKEKWGSGLG